MNKQMQMATIATLAQQLTLAQQVNASLDAQDYYQECRADGMCHADANYKATEHHIKALRAMVNDKTLSISI